MKPFLTLLLIAIAACAPSRYVGVRHYALAPQPRVEPSAAPSDASLGIRPLDAVRGYGTRIVARDGDLEVSFLPHASWTERPAEAATRALIDGLTASGHFADVGNAADMFGPDYILTGEVRRFDVLRSETPWRVVCEARLEVRAGRARTPVWQDTLRIDAPADADTVTAAASAMSDALGAMAAEAAIAIVNAVSGE